MFGFKKKSGPAAAEFGKKMDAIERELREQSNQNKRLAEQIDCSAQSIDRVGRDGKNTLTMKRKQSGDE